MPAEDKISRPSGPQMMTELGDTQGIDRVHQFIQRTNNRGENKDDIEWMSTITPYLSVHSHSSSMPHPRINFRFTVCPVHCNQLGNLHGGCTSTIFDICTTLPLHLINKPGFWMYLGVSRTLNCTYLKPVPCGTTVDIQCEILSVGKRLCVIKGEMRAVDEEGKLGALLTVCEHGKVSTDAQMEKL
ncbi:hypothetical protein AB5N19_02514 [Seiridium cardinale]